MDEESVRDPRELSMSSFSPETEREREKEMSKRD